MKPREMSEKLKEQNFGCEIEMYGITRKKASVLAAEYFGGQFRYTDPQHGYQTWSAFEPNGREWKFSRDSSIMAACDDERCEMITPILRYEEMDMLFGLVRMLRANGARSDPNHGCGVHIHVDGAEHTAQTIKNLVRLVYSHEDQLAEGINLDTHREQAYSKKVSEGFLNRLNKMKKVSLVQIEEEGYDGYENGYDTRFAHYNGSRYRMLNLHSFFHGHGTVEFRCFQFQNPTPERRNGLHCGQLKAMIQMALAISNAAKVSRSTRCKKSGKANTTQTFKSWLYRIGFVGKEFETARKYWSRETERTTREVDRGLAVA